MGKELIVIYGGPIDVTPEEALLQEVRRTAGHVAWLGRLIAGMESEDELWGYVGSAGSQSDEKGSRDFYASIEPVVWLRLYHQERAHLKSVAKAAIDAGIAERQVRLAEQQADLLAGALQAILNDLGLTEKQRKQAPGIVRRHLQSLPTGTG